MYIVFVYLLRFLSLYLGVTTTLLTMAKFGNSKASFYYRLFASYACLLICSVYGVFAAIALRLVGRHRITQWTTARAFKWTMSLTTGVRFVVVSGREHLNTRPAVFIGNHQSELDVLLLGAIMPPYCAVTAKKSLARIPFLGWYMALSGTVFIDRANRGTALKAFEGAAHEMRRERQSVFIFPEGTRSYAEEPMLLGFKKGAFHLAVQAQVDIVPMVAGNYWGVLGAREGRFVEGEIPVRVLRPISTKGLTSNDVEELARNTRELMLKELMELTESPAGRKVATPALRNE